MGMPELVWWWAFLGNGTLRSNTIINEKECKYTYKLRYMVSEGVTTSDLIAMNARNALVHGI